MARFDITRARVHEHQLRMLVELHVPWCFQCRQAAELVWEHNVYPRHNCGTRADFRVRCHGERQDLGHVWTSPDTSKPTDQAVRDVLLDVHALLRRNAIVFLPDEGAELERAFLEC